MQNWVFLCSLDNLHQKNVIVLFLEIKFQNGAQLKKGLFLTYFSFFSHQGKVIKIPSAHISLTYTYFAHPIDIFFFFFLPYQFREKIRIYQILFLFGMSPGVNSIRTILEQSINNKLVSKIYVGMSTTDMYLH